MIAFRPAALRVTTALLAGLFSMRASAQCGPGAGDCYEPHGTPGCVQTACCELVCEFDALCCDVGWDEFCVSAAEKLCEGIACPNPGSCLEFHENPGCEDETCCDFVCVLDPFCCGALWDDLCVERAMLCAVPACTIEPPASAREEAEPCYERLNDGCSLDEPMFESLGAGEVVFGKWTSNGARDTDWYRLDDSVDRVLVRAEFPVHLTLVRGDCEGTLEVLAEAFGDPCPAGGDGSGGDGSGGEGLEMAIAPAWRGDPTLAVVVAGGTQRAELRRRFACDEIDPKNPPDPKAPPPPDPPYGLRYLIEVPGGVLIGDLDLDGDVDGADLAILLGAWGTAGGPADLDGSGVVDGADLAALLGGWTGS